MRERPMPFTADMVRAILDGRKTQTRRPVKSLLGFGEITEFQVSDTPGYAWSFRNRRMLWNDLRHTELMAACPYGQPGDRLWVREPGRVTDVYRSDAGFAVDISYAAGGGLTLELPDRFVCEGNLPLWALEHHGIPNGIFREAARIFLEIVSVRVERLEDITIADAQAEGFGGHGAIIPFIQTWSRMYQHRGFGCDSKPWLWVVEFKRAEASV